MTNNQPQEEKKVQGSFRMKRGGWEYRITYKNVYDQKKEKSFSAPTKEQCLKRAEEFLHKMDLIFAGYDVYVTIPQILIGKIEDDFAKGYTGEQGYDRNLKTVDIIKRNPLGSMPIVDIKEMHLNFFLQQITSYSNNTIRKVYSMLNTAYRLAVDDELVPKNLMTARALRCPRSKKKDKKVRGLTEEEQRALLETLATYKVPHGRNDYRTQLYIELFAGLRMGEINALKPSNIVIKGDSGFIHVEDTVARGLECRPFIKDGTKTDAGVRDVPISKPLMPILKEALKNKKKNPMGLLFYDYNKDSLVETNQVNSFYRRVCQKAGIEFLGQHSLRHTFATRCIESGVPAVVLKTWLGHTDIHITLDTYSDVFNRMHADAIDQYSNYIDNVLELKIK